MFGYIDDEYQTNEKVPGRSGCWCSAEIVIQAEAILYLTGNMFILHKLDK